MRRNAQGLVILAVCALVLIAGCRRNRPTLVDTNQPPDTQLWYAPPDSSEYDYVVHLYWRGTDGDGTTDRFIWTVRDTLATDETRWNPATRLSDYQTGHITELTDSVLSFTAYKNVSGVGVRKNRQAFYVASIDDNGVIDPTPAAVEFVATIEKLPTIHFVTHVGGGASNYSPSAVPLADTLGMFTPFQISYHGATSNGQLRGYFYYTLNSNIALPGANAWTQDLSDTLRSFPNTGVDALPPGTLRFVAKCIDDANAESPVDGSAYQSGVCQVVVGFDPDTRITEVYSNWYWNGHNSPVPIDFQDAQPDTVPYGSWVNFRYEGWDDRRDVESDSLTCSLTDPDKCIDFQISYVGEREGVTGRLSGWVPRNGVHDSDAKSATDSNSVNIGTLDYRWYVRSIDADGTREGTPPVVRIVGNYAPILDTAGMANHDNTDDPLDIALVDTMTWNLYRPENADTFIATLQKYKKTFGWTITATAHDDPRDPPGSAVKDWRYFIYTDYNPVTGTGTPWLLGRAGSVWYPGVADGVMIDDKFAFSVFYSDSLGDDLFANLPGFFNKVITVVLYGRDGWVRPGGTGEEFAQYMFYKDPVQSGTIKYLDNQYDDTVYHRETPRKVMQFYLKFER